MEMNVTMQTSKSVSERSLEDEGEKITVGLLQRIMPAGRKNLITQELVGELNGLLEDEKLRENFRENLLSYTKVLADPRFRMKDYINAVKYVSYKLLGDTNIEAFTRVFPEKFQNYLDRELSSKEIANHVASFNRGQLVGKIMEQSMIPSYVINQGLYQKALNCQADLMMNARSEKVRSDAANSLLTQLKMPETAKVELDVTVKEDDSINELRKVTLDLVAQQRRMLEAGAMTAGEVARQKVVQGEVVNEQ